MSIIDKLEEKATNSRPCKVCNELAVMELRDQEQVKQILLGAVRYPIEDLADVLREMGHDVSATGLRRHRKHI